KTCMLCLNTSKTWTHQARRIQELLQSTRMAPSGNSKSISQKMFITVGLFLLVAGMTWGVIGGFQYIVPGFMKKYLSFEKVRPLHVSSVVFWIILAAIGGVLNYVQEHTGKKLYSTKLAAIQLWMFVAGIGAILISYCFGIFGGREYWEFHPVLALPIV